MYILQNQDGYFLAKSGEWVDGREPSQLFKTNHHDEAVNQLFEVNSRDYSLRITMMICEPNTKGQPIIPEDQLPPILAPILDSSEDEKTTKEMDSLENTAQSSLELTSSEQPSNEVLAS